MLTIARLNWPFYWAASLVLFGAIVAIILTSVQAVRIVCGIAFGGSAYFLLLSLGVSHVIYDRSDLYRWRWLDRALRGTACGPVIFCHSGFDESSSALREKFGTAEWIVLDHYDPNQMTEASIQRARRLYPPVAGTVAAPYDCWSVSTKSAKIIFGLLAIHELRSHNERSAWFSEAKRCLQPGGRVVIVEHLRDLPNFLAFGPGFLHFHSATTWQRSWEDAGLRAVDDFRLTPWLRVFILGVS